MNLRRTAIRPTSMIIALLATFAAVLATVLAAPAASAVSSRPGDFSSLVSRPNPQTFWVDDCYVEVGVVVDTVAYPNYRHVGGVRVNCNSRHSVIDATVAIYYWNGSRYVQYGHGTYGVRYNSTGSGAGTSGILRTLPYCVGSLRAQAWIVGATVRTEHAGLTRFSTWQMDTRAGC